MNACAYPFTIAGYVDFLASLAGIRASKEDPDTYADVVARSGPPAARSFLAGITPEGAANSGCMVVGCGAIENFFAWHDKPCPLRSPVGFDRWGIATAWAAQHRALIAAGQWTTREPGDLVLLFTPPNHQHWVSLLNDLGSSAGYGDWTTIEGGGTPINGYQHIEEARRFFTAANRETYSGHKVAQIIRVRTLIEAAQ